jgi:AcrR family transcriptional regulator
MGTGPPQRDAQATRRRLLAAAATEFAEYGIAGGRVDRIAAQARSNKAQIYHYFGSKDHLFDAVFEQVIAVVLAEAPLDATDLPDYAGRLFDGYVKYPEIARLATWYRLERASEQDLIQAVVESNAAKVEAIADAQADGAITDEYTPEVLLGLVIHLAALWSSQTPEYDHLTSDLGNRQRREIVVSAVRSLIEPD